MTKRIIYTILIISLIAFLPAFSGNAALPPTFDDSVSPNATYDYDGNTIEVIEQTPELTTILLNGTYELQLEHNATNVGVLCTELDPSLSPQADEMVFDVDFETSVDGQHLTVVLPDMAFELSSSGPNNDEWNTTIFGSEPIEISFNSTSGDFLVADLTNTVEMIGGYLIINDGVGPTGLVISRLNETTWDIITPAGIIIVNFNGGAGYLHIDYLVPIFDGPFPLGPLPVPIYADLIIAIDFDGNSVTIGYAGVSICINSFMLVLIFDYISITWFFGFLIERLVILIWDLTIILYISIVELLIVIIYYTFEIKIYESQIVIVYEYIEIIFLFVSIIIWELTFIFHFEFWFIQLIFIIDIVVNIINQPIRFVFIPIIIPVFIPIIYYVPVLIKENIHVYLPYASPQLFIDVESEEMGSPTCTLQYFVFDAAGLPVDDATVIVNYNGYVYPATFLANGVYEVVVGTAETKQALTVTATKAWYPDAVLTYALNITQPEEVNITTTVTVTAPSPLSIVSVIVSLVAVSIVTMVINKKKKK